jgi:uroporphyrinogen-III synthase
LKVKTILVSQPEPNGEKSPYFDLAKKYKLKIDFRPFIRVEPVPVKEFRKQRINLNEYTAVVLTSRNAVDNYFRMCEEARFTVPDSMKYFCISEATAFYMQKYVTYRKRKIFCGQQKFSELVDIIKKHKNEKFLLPVTDIHKQEMVELLDQANVRYTKGIFYKTVASDLSDLKDVNYDMLVFFSPGGIKSLLENFPQFKQNETRIAAFGSTTAQAVTDSGLRLDLHAPMPGYPSMTMAIEHFIKKEK